MRLVDVAQFKILARNHDKRLAKLAVRKQMIAPAGPAGELRSLCFTISTGDVDREQDRIAIAGWDLANYRRNPVVLWGHNSEQLPIGRGVNLRIEGNALKADVEFVPADTPAIGDFAEAVYRLARGGFLAATSVGFRPIKWDYSSDPSRGADDWFPGIDFEQQELVELSIVTVPANPEALIENPGPGEGTAIANDTPPATGTEVTQWTPPPGDFERDAALFRGISQIFEKQEQERKRARRRRVFQLALAQQGD